MYTIDEQYDSTMYAASYCYLIAASAVYISVVQTFSNRKKATCKKATWPRNARMPLDPIPPPN